MLYSMFQIGIVQVKFVENVLAPTNRLNTKQQQLTKDNTKRSGNWSGMKTDVPEIVVTITPSKALIYIYINK
jgi:hypothetical protein